MRRLSSAGLLIAAGVLLPGCGESPADLTLEENVRRAQEHQANGENDEAVEYYTEALSREPRNYMMLNNRAAAYTALQKYDEAVADLTQAIRFGKGASTTSYVNRSAIYFNAGMLDEALADINEAIKIEPKNGEAHWVRGTIYHFQKKPAESARDLKQARELGFKPANEVDAAAP